MISRRAGIYLLVALTIALGVAGLLAPRTPQPLSYHHFADQRSWLGIANFGDVVSNILFAVFGVLGLVYLSGESSQTQFIDARERWFYLLVFLGLLLTAFESSYYHLAPDNARLVWDRLPMTLVFTPLVAAMIAERISIPTGLWLLPVLVGIGIASVLQWYASELRGHGDLRFYAALQIYAVLVLLVALLLPPRYTRSSDLFVVATLYVVAKICENADRQIFSIGHIISGHTLKHLAAGVAGFWILRMLQKRQTIQNQPAR
ncbi:MAG TPA: hypothetical protein VI431_16605 [Candidatus Acidoferrum sp.]